MRWFSPPTAQISTFSSGRNSAETALEQQLATQFPHLRRDLVLWHAADTVHPQGTAAWLDARIVKTHYHVRDLDAGHFGRMARRLVNKAIGVTLAGGGARGYVHVGVFQAMEELGIPVDYLGGTSFGTIIGALRARDWSIEQMMVAIKRFSRNEMLFDRTLPIVALNNSTKVTRFLQALYGHWRIEDLWIPFFGVSTNLTQQRAEIQTRGLVWQALRQSISIPSVFVPVCEDGDVFVDGGVMNNFPVDVMLERAETDRIIGVRLDPPSGRKREYDIDYSASGWQVLGARFNPMGRKIKTPPIVDTILRSMLVNSMRLVDENSGRCALLLSPNPKGYSLLEFEKYAAIAKLGYEQTVEPLKAWAQQEGFAAPTITVANSPSESE